MRSRLASACSDAIVIGAMRSIFLALRCQCLFCAVQRLSTCALTPCACDPTCQTAPHGVTAGCADVHCAVLSENASPSKKQCVVCINACASVPQLQAGSSKSTRAETLGSGQHARAAVVRKLGCLLDLRHVECLVKAAHKGVVGSETICAIVNRGIREVLAGGSHDLDALSVHVVPAAQQGDSSQSGARCCIAGQTGDMTTCA
jgi:hypothetical protein